MRQADVLLIMSCAFGVQTIARQMKKMVVPALDTLFVGKETGVGLFDEICTQCGACIIGETGGICPVTSCHKGMVNGPCGGTNNGKCEIDTNKDCAWTLIYNRLKELGRLDAMRKYQKPRNHRANPGRESGRSQEVRHDFRIQRRPWNPASSWSPPRWPRPRGRIWKR